MLVIDSSQKKKDTLTPQEIVDIVKSTLSEGKLVALVNDFDLTVSDPGVHSGNPFDSKVFPETGKALANLEQKRVVIGAISNRSGEQIAKRYKDAGVKNPFIIGTYGLEVYVANTANPAENQSIVEDRYLLLKNRITDILNFVTHRFFEEIRLPSFNNRFAEVIIPTPDGPIYVENKAISSDFPQGLAQVYNLNKLNLTARKNFVQVMEKAFWDSLDTWEVNSSDSIREMWGISTLGDIHREEFTWALEPLIKEGKGYGITKLLRFIDESKKYSKPIGLVIYGGDEEADAQAVLDAQTLSDMSEEKGKLKVIGVWVNPGKDKPEMKAVSDIEVEGVPAYAKLLSDIADTI